MQLNNMIYCNSAVFSIFVTEELLQKKNYSVSITDYYNLIEYMIFLGKKDDDSCYEVIIYKANQDNIYIPHNLDKIENFEETEEYIIFYFENFEFAHEFIETLFCRHPEYIERPIRERTFLI